MNLNKSTRYALYAALEMADAGSDETVTASRVAASYGVPEAVVAKALQQLGRAGLAVGFRGASGGYQLARPASEVTVLDVVQVFEPMPEPGRCLLDPSGACTRSGRCRLRRLLDEVDEVTRATLASTSLETLSRS